MIKTNKFFRNLAVILVAISATSCIQKIFSDELIKDSDLPKGILPTNEMTYGNAKDEKYAEHAVKFTFTRSDNFSYSSIELLGDGTFLLLEYPSKAGYDGYIAGGYTVEAKGRYSLEDFGTLQIEENGDSYNLVFDNLNGNRISTVYAVKEQAQTDNATKSLCRTWQIQTTEEWMYLGSSLLINTKYHGGDEPYFEGVVGVDDEEMQYNIDAMCKTMRFTPYGTYYCTYNNGTERISTWKWGDAEKGILFFDWEYGEQDEGYVTVRFAGSQLRTYEDYIFNLEDYIEEESDDEESQAYIDVLSAFTGDKQLRYLIVNTMTSNN